MTHLKRATEAPDYVVDEDTGVLLNTNARGLEAYRAQRAVALQQIHNQTRIDRLESTIDELKELLRQALNK